MKKTRKRREFRHLNQKDRDRIHALYGHSHKKKEIAEVLRVHPSTITRELERYGRRTWRYSADRAQKDADEKRSHSKTPGMKIEAHPELRQYIIAELRKLRSPDEIAGRMKEVRATPRAGKNAIYKWLYSDSGKSYCKYLCTKRTKKKKQHKLGTRVHIPDRISLKDRPNESDLIHAERDLFVSPTRLGVKDSGLLIVVPETKLFVGELVPNKTSEVVTKATRAHFDRMSIDTCLADNGSENVGHKDTGVDTYFCDPGAPWQKPHVEGGIGLARRWFLPKGTDLSKVPDETFQSQLHLLNHKWRKSLGYRSAYEVSLERGIIKSVPRVSLSKAIAFR
jgi:transposase, IS30 family